MNARTAFDELGHTLALLEEMACTGVVSMVMAPSRFVSNAIQDTYRGLDHTVCDTAGPAISCLCFVAMTVLGAHLETRLANAGVGTVFLLSMVSVLAWLGPILVYLVVLLPSMAWRALDWMLELVDSLVVAQPAPGLHVERTEPMLAGKAWHQRTPGPANSR